MLSMCGSGFKTINGYEINNKSFIFFSFFRICEKEQVSGDMHILKSYCNI